MRAGYQGAQLTKQDALIMTAPRAPFDSQGNVMEDFICVRSCFMLEPTGAVLAAETGLDGFVAAEAAHWTATLTPPRRRSSTVGCMVGGWSDGMWMPEATGL